MTRIAARLKCDNCDLTAKGGEYHFGLPEGWYILGYHCQTYVGYDDWRTLKHFCSWDCMIKRVRADGKEIKAEFNPPSAKILK